MNHNLLAALALGTLGALASPSPAQQPAGTTQTQPPPSEPTVNLDFQGGRLSDLIAALRSSGERVNIAAPEAAAQVTVPPMQLRGVTADSALRAAATIVEAQYDIDVQPIGQPGRGMVIALRIREKARNVQAVVNGAPAGGPQEMVEVFSLREITKPAPGEEAIVVPTATVLSAVDTALALAEPGTKPTVKYHEDSGLLFVSGTPQHVHIVRSVLRQLEVSVGTARGKRIQEKHEKAAEQQAKDQAKEKTEKPVR